MVATHLSFVRSWNGRQLRSLARALGTHRRPLFLVGDLNMGRRRAVGATGMRPLASALTFPAEQPREQLDHVLADGPVGTVSSYALRLPLSDHRALVVDLARR